MTFLSIESPIRKPLIFLLTTYIIVATVFLFSGQGGPNTSKPNNEVLGSQNTETIYSSIFTNFEGVNTSLEIYKDRPLIINFFASWCTPCVQEMPDFEKIHQEFGDEVTILGLAIEGITQAQKIVKTTGVTYRTGIDDNDLLAEFGGIAMPTTIFVSIEGLIVDRYSGVLTYEDLRNKITTEFGI
jgi:thiol-disulfide isomerase/thioredoxin|tara:strand:- start:209 stop:763 length:555 start_codon:yes stop_codon:yes gene_type:complete